MMDVIKSSPALTFADDDIVEQTLALLLRFNAAKLADDGGDHASHIAAKRLIKGLKRSGFVLMKHAQQPALSLWD